MTTPHTCNYFNTYQCKSCSRINQQSRVPVLPDKLLSLSEKTNPWELSPSALGLRAKARMSVTGTTNHPVLGILDSNLHGVELTQCLQHRSIIKEVLLKLPKLLSRHSIIPYSITDRTGELKSVILQTNKKEDHIRIRFVSNSEFLQTQIKNLALDLAQELNIKLSVSLNIQPIPHQIPEGPTEFHIHGEELLWEIYGETKISFHSKSFMQVTPEIATKLYGKAIEIVKKYPNSKVLDLFCGSGGFALSVAPYAKEVLGIEVVKESVESARISAAANQVLNTKFQQGDLLTSLDEIKSFKPDIIICNPPRRGLGETVINFIKDQECEVFIYSSCNVNSFLKDFEGLRDLYTIKECTPFEMFPLTEHYEVLVEMGR